MKHHFLTGVYRDFDPSRIRRETRSGFWGLEVSMLRSIGEAYRLTDFAWSSGLRIGIHYPLVEDPSSVNCPHAMIASANRSVRERALAAVEKELRLAKDLGSPYLIVHYPKPAVLDDRLDWSDWRFARKGETIPANSTCEEEQIEIASHVLALLSALSTEVGVKIVIEHDILHAWHYLRLFPKLLGENPNLGFCIDSGRLHLQEHTDPGFSARAFLEAVSAYISNVHLWTVQLGQNKMGGHHPVLPSLTAEEGWADIGGLLSFLAEVSSSKTATTPGVQPELFVTFEHRADLVTGEDLAICYSWVGRSLGTPNQVDAI